MGRRSRARDRASRPAPAPRRDEAAGRSGRLVAALNPFSFQRPTRARVRYAAIGFGVLAVVLAVLGWLTRTAGWFNSAVLLAILAVAWGLRAVFMGEDEPRR